MGLQGKSIDWFLFYMRGTLVEKGLGKDLLQNRASFITNGGDTRENYKFNDNYTYVICNVKR